MDTNIWSDFDPAELWASNQPDFVKIQPFTDEMVREAEQKLGYTLPQSYIQLMKTQNGGYLSRERCCYSTDTPNGWAEDHFHITDIIGIGEIEDNSPEMIQEWGYPPIGVMFGFSPTAGHDAFFFDYRNLNAQGEPQIAFVNVETGDDIPEIFFVAPDFETFFRGLVSESLYDPTEEWYQRDLIKVQEGTFSSLLSAMVQHQTLFPDLEAIIRNLCLEITHEKHGFYLHDDPKSVLVYDLQFWLFSTTYGVPSKEDYLENHYSKIIALPPDGAFHTEGYAPAFVENWLDEALKAKRIIRRNGKLQFSQQAELELFTRLREYRSKD